MMNIAIIGTGYVGLVSGTCLAEYGMHVTCVDRVKEKITLLRQGSIPIYEPDLQELVLSNMEAGRLHFTTDMAEAVRGADVVMIAVGTPTRALDGNADLQYVFAAAEELAHHLQDYTVIVTKSTVPVGTSNRIHEIICQANPKANFDVASNPEFLREGNAVIDFMRPDRIVIGTNTARAEETLRALYRPFTEAGYSLVATDIISSELTKYAANTFLATKVSFINEIADMCEKLGANVQDISYAMGLDHRIGKAFLQPGPGYGGSCFPKDTLAMVTIGERALSPATIVDAVINVNRARPHRMVAKIRDALGGNVRNAKIALLGLTFKANTDDVRDSVALLIADELAHAGASVIAYDPQGIPHARMILGDSIDYAPSMQDALRHADCVVIATEWDEFKNFALTEYHALLAQPIMIDLRNLFICATMQDAGFTYYSIGRPIINKTTDL